MVENNNKQFTTNSEIFKVITEITNTVNTIKGDSFIETLKKKRNQYIKHELQILINTITLGKVGTLNPVILHLDELKNITDHQNGLMSITDLMDISEFKIAQKNNVIIIYIKYPKILFTCKYYETRSIAQLDGKLIIDQNVINCNNEFLNVKNCKTEITSTYCKLNKEKTCFSELLNKKPAKCKKIKERNNNIEIIKEGVILISGKNKVEKQNLTGTYLVTFENQTIINNITYVNIESKIWNYLTQNHVNNFKILEYMETTNEHLKLENINFLGKKNEDIKRHSIYFYIFIAF